MIGKAVLLIVLIALIGIAGYFAYNIYLDNYSKLEEFVAKPANTSQPSYEGELQFYPNMRFNKLALSYLIGEECGEDKKTNMLSAFDFIENKTSLFFYESEKPDILVNCGEQYTKEDLFVAGEGGPSSFIDTGDYNVILQGKIVLFYEENCKDNVELHELLHVLGFSHSDNPESIMYNISKCDQVVTDDIIEEINRLYSIQPLADLYFNNIFAVKHGRYLDANFTVKNQGLINAKEISVEIYSEEKIESFELGLIEFGAGKVLSVTNLKLPSRDIGEIEFFINYPEKEIDKDNNNIKLTLAE